VTHILQNNKVVYLVGQETVSTRPLAPYGALLCDFLNDLSSELRSYKEGATYPDIMAFVFWCRKANIARLKAAFEDGKSRLGLGLVFHITPSNVPINFAFSFAFGLLSGNANIVRVPSKPFGQIDIICACLSQLLNYDKYSQIKAMTAFVKYEQNDEITGKFCAGCNARIIWGGDAAISNIRKLPMPPRSVEIVFSDRYSFCVIDAPAVIKLDEAGLSRLAENFYNDTYLMDQNACSSPHLIIWLGEKKEMAKEKFWAAVYRIVSKRYQLIDVNAVDKYTLLCHNAIELDNISGFKKHSNCVYRIAIDKLVDNMDTLRGRCGCFYEYDTNDINGIAGIINSRYQTMTYFGADKSQLLDFVVKNRLLGIDRIVPVGKALDIDVIWDGYDIVRSLSRIIDVK
jgi:hypothetical protein